MPGSLKFLNKISNLLDIILDCEHNIYKNKQEAVIMKYISVSEAAGLWNLSKRRVITLCNDDRIEGAQKVGAAWIIPASAKMPADARIKSGKYIKKCEVWHDA